VHGIALSPEGHPQWVVLLSPSDDREEAGNGLRELGREHD